MAEFNMVPTDGSASHLYTSSACGSDLVANTPSNQDSTPARRGNEKDSKKSTPDSGYHSPDDPLSNDSNDRKQSSLNQELPKPLDAARTEDETEVSSRAEKGKERTIKKFPEAIDSFLKLRDWRKYAWGHRNITEPPNRASKIAFCPRPISPVQIRHHASDSESPKAPPTPLSDLTTLQESLIDIRTEEFAPNLHTPTPSQRNTRPGRATGITALPWIARTINAPSPALNAVSPPRTNRDTLSELSPLNISTIVAETSTPGRTTEIPSPQWTAGTTSVASSHLTTPVAGGLTSVRDMNVDPFPWTPSTNAGPLSHTATLLGGQIGVGTHLGARFTSNLTPEATPLNSTSTTWEISPKTGPNTDVVPQSNCPMHVEDNIAPVSQHVRQIADIVKEKQSQRQQQLGRTAIQAFHPSHTVQHSYGLLADSSSPAINQQLSLPRAGALITYNSNSSYHGDPTNASSRSAPIPDSENCALWILGLHAHVTYHHLLTSIRDVGKVYATVINPATGAHSTSAAKIVFFTRRAAEKFSTQIGQRAVKVQGQTIASVRWNKIKSAEYLQRDHSRAIRIQGPKELMDFAFFECFFKERFTYELDQRMEVECVVEGMAAHEWHFGSLRCQAASAKTAIERELQGIFTVTWASDPCAYP